MTDMARGCIVLLATILHLVSLSHPSPSTPLVNQGVVLSELIRTYEPVLYDREETLRTHRRLRRDAQRQPDPYNHRHPLRVHFSTQHRDFRLKLYPDREVFSTDISFTTGTGKTVNFDQGKAYVGTLEDDEEAVVRGVMTEDGLFDGTVETRLETYYVEPVGRYTRDALPFHSVVYRARDVVDPRAPACASQLLDRRRRRHAEPVLFLDHDTYEVRRANRSSILVKRPFLKVIVGDGVDGEEEIRTRPRVPAPAQSVDPTKTTCMLYLQADHLFFQKYGTEEACIEVMTRHVQRVNSIYKNTDFNQDGKSDNISFMIKRIKVHTADSLNDPSYRFPGNYGVEKFLELFSEEDYDQFCLAYMFTYRDFEMGTLGLAWTGDLKNAGGVCEKNGHYRGSMKSLNTGIVTLLNYGKHVPPAVSHVTLAHEIGHNFGSPHDPEMCTPGGEDGNFIMFARATSGDKKNNNKFSPCSLNSINPVLNTKARSSKGCFTEPQGAICGNGVVEEGEQCDCGWEEDCKEDCCYPQRRHPPIDQPPCHLTPHSTCSPSQGPCCTAECSLKFGDKCRDDNGCRDASFCDGRGPHCPTSINKPNKTVCNEEFVCFMGECTGSICLAYGLESCQCIPGPEDPQTKACELCCKQAGENQPCMSSFALNNVPFDVPDMYSKPGTPCNDYNGYCDVFQKCREVDPSGPLATLRKLLLSEESIASFKRWIMDRWYYALLIVTSILLILVLSTRLLGKRTDMKLKGVTIVHSSTTETVRLPQEEGGNVTVHPVARSKLPLNRKVRPRKHKRTQPPPRKKAPDKKKKVKKAVIDYSAEQEKTRTKVVKSPEEDSFGKVRNWLLNSHIDMTAIRKSKSSPAGFSAQTETPATRPSAVKVKQRTQPVKEPVKLQVTYKPPFKFSVKLKKPTQVATRVVKEINQKVSRQRAAILVKERKQRHRKTKNRDDVTDAVPGPSKVSPEVPGPSDNPVLAGPSNPEPSNATDLSMAGPSNSSSSLAGPSNSGVSSAGQSNGACPASNTTGPSTPTTVPETSILLIPSSPTVAIAEPVYQNVTDGCVDLLRMSSVECRSHTQLPLVPEDCSTYQPPPPSDILDILPESQRIFPDLT